MRSIKVTVVKCDNSFCSHDMMGREIVGPKIEKACARYKALEALV